MQVCVALDMVSKEDNLSLIKQIKGFDVWLKVGLRSYIRDGYDFIKQIKDINPNFKIFLDLKLYDIPNTMADTAEVIAGMDIDMFNIHASSGKEGMDMVMKRISNIPNRPLVLAVTALTSFDNDSFRYIYNQDIASKANQFAKDSYDSSLDGVVCSVFESKSIKQITNQDFITLTPGIRPFDEDTADQKRVANIAMAKEQLSDFVVIGRPIYQSKNQADKLKAILEQI